MVSKRRKKLCLIPSLQFEEIDFCHKNAKVLSQEIVLVTRTFVLIQEFVALSAKPVFGEHKCKKKVTKRVNVHQHFLWDFNTSWEYSSHLPREYPIMTMSCRADITRGATMTYVIFTVEDKHPVERQLLVDSFISISATSARWRMLLVLGKRFRQEMDLSLESLHGVRIRV